MHSTLHCPYPQAAGGASSIDGKESALARRVLAAEERCGVVLGSRESVAAAAEAMLCVN